MGNSKMLVVWGVKGRFGSIFVIFYNIGVHLASNKGKIWGMWKKTRVLETWNYILGICPPPWIDDVWVVKNGCIHARAVIVKNIELNFGLKGWSYQVNVFNILTVFFHELSKYGNIFRKLFSVGFFVVQFFSPWLKTIKVIFELNVNNRRLYNNNICSICNYFTPTIDTAWRQKFFFSAFSKKLNNLLFWIRQIVISIIFPYMYLPSLNIKSNLYFIHFRWHSLWIDDIVSKYE